MSTSYFASTPLLEKETLLRIFRRNLQTALLIMAPFGIPDFTGDLLGPTLAMKNFKNTLRNLEDQLSRKAVGLHNVNDDAMAATLQEYIEKRRDVEVMNVMRQSNEAAEQLLIPPDVVELPLSANATLAAALLQSMLTISQKISSELAAHATTSIHTRNLYNPCDAAHFIQTLSVSTLAALHDMLHMHDVSYQQYLHTIQCHITSPEVEAVLDAFQLPRGYAGLKYLQTSPAPLINPYISYIHSAHCSDAVMDLIVRYDNLLCDRSQRDVELMDQFDRMDTHENIMERCEAAEAAVCAVETLFQSEETGIHEMDILFSDIYAERSICRLSVHELENALSDAATSISLNPMNSLAYKCRAKIYYAQAEAMQQDEECSDEEEGEDLAQRRIALLQQCADDFISGSFPSVLCFLTFAAFILSGSTDITLAGMAEEVARDAVRDSARDFYWETVNDEASESGSENDSNAEEVNLFDFLFTSNGISDKNTLLSPALPRRWLVTSFLEMYPSFMKSLNVHDSTKRVSNGIDDLCHDFQHLLTEEHLNDDEEAYAVLKDVAMRFDAIVKTNPEHTFLPQDAFCEELCVEFEDEQYTTEKTISLDVINDLDLLRMEDLSAEDVMILEGAALDHHTPFQPSAHVNAPCADLLEILRILSSPKMENLLGVEFVVRNGESRRIFIRVDAAENVSPKIRARVLVLVAILGYLLGDAMGCYECLKSSIMADEDLLISRILISSILVEMDEVDKAERQLREANRLFPANNLVYYALSQVHIHQCDFAASQSYLENLLDFVERRSVGSNDVLLDVAAGVFNLMATVEFRLHPTKPHVALEILRRGIAKYPHSCTLYLTFGEIAIQAGNIRNALLAFRISAEIDSTHPFPFLNCARLYQQVNQLYMCKLHMQQALAIDDTLSVTLIELAQSTMHHPGISALHSSEFPEYSNIDAKALLSRATTLSRHASEVVDIFTARLIYDVYDKYVHLGIAQSLLG